MSVQPRSLAEKLTTRVREPQLSVAAGGQPFEGLIWSLGGHYTPFPGSYLIVNYGRQEGLLGFPGALRYEITPLTVALASYSRNRGSQQEQIFNNLNSSGADAWGNVVKVKKSRRPACRPGEPAIGVVNECSFQFDTARGGLQTRLDGNTFGLYHLCTKRRRWVAALCASPPRGGDTGTGVDFELEPIADAGPHQPCRDRLRYRQLSATRRH